MGSTVNAYVIRSDGAKRFIDYVVTDVSKVEYRNDVVIIYSHPDAKKHPDEQRLRAMIKLGELSVVFGDTEPPGTSSTPDVSSFGL